MKNLIRIFTLLTAFIFVLIIFSGKVSAQQRYMNYQGFYDQLSPYGQWAENPNYGYVWIPYEGSGFTPYLSNGYWVLTDYGWTWVSGYNWGWATFHYGRWDYNNDYGWFWVPDNEWGPSWVIWRSSGGYYGWAPMRPGVSISVTFGNNYNEPNDRWVFVRDRDFERHDIDRNYIDRSNNVTIINNSTVINKTYYDNSRHTTYISGPDRRDVEKVTGRTIKPVTVREKDKPGEVLNNDQLQIYRPEVQKDKSGNKLAPAKVTDIKDLNTKKNPQNKQILKDKTVKDQQPVIKPTNKNNTNGNTRQKQSTDPPNKNINKEKQPIVNPTIKSNTKENTHQKKNVNPSNNNINKEKQPVVNPANKNNAKENVRQKQNTNTPSNKINKKKQPVVNSTNKNNFKDDTNQNPNTDSLNNNINKKKQPIQVNKTNSKENPNQPPKKK